MSATEWNEPNSYSIESSAPNPAGEAHDASLDRLEKKLSPAVLTV